MHYTNTHISHICTVYICLYITIHTLLEIKIDKLIVISGKREDKQL